MLGVTPCMPSNPNVVCFWEASWVVPPTSTLAFSVWKNTPVMRSTPSTSCPPTPMLSMPDDDGGGMPGLYEPE